MSQLNIDVVTPKGIKFSGEAIICTAPGWGGEFQILKDHFLLVVFLPSLYGLRKLSRFFI